MRRDIWYYTQSLNVEQNQHTLLLLYYKTFREVLCRVVQNTMLSTFLGKQGIRSTVDPGTS